METIGSYAILGRIAMGGMAEIFRARQMGDVGFEKDVVLKRILPQFTEDDEFIKMFHHEALLAAKLNHPNIVQVFDFKLVDGAYVMVMELVEGIDLRRVDNFSQKAGKPIGQNRAVQIALGMARGLGHAHERVVDGLALKIVHRDVSPHNVLISLSGDVKVMDFGIAKATARAFRTSTGVLKGKISYMSPEQARGEEIDHRTDIFATGVVLWEMLAGRKMVSGDNEIEMLQRVQKGAVPDVRELCPDVHPQLEAVLKKMLAADKAERHARMRDAERELSQCLHQLGGSDAAPLDEFVREVVPQNIIEALSAVAQPERSTKPLHDPSGAATESILPPADATVSERKSVAGVEAGETRTGSAPRALSSSAPRTITAPAPEPPPKRKLVPLVGISVVAGLGIALAAWMIDSAPREPKMGDLTQVITLEPQPPVADPPLPPPAPTASTGSPGAASGPMAPTSKVEKVETKKKDEGRTKEPAGGGGRSRDPDRGSAERGKDPERGKDGDRGKDNKPPPAAVSPSAPAAATADQSRIAFKCPAGSVVFAGTQKLGTITHLNASAFPVPEGSTTITVRDASGTAVLGQQQVALAKGETERFACGR